MLAIKTDVSLRFRDWCALDCLNGTTITTFVVRNGGRSTSWPVVHAAQFLLRKVSLDRLCDKPNWRPMS